jgi:hypothetical protein
MIADLSYWLIGRLYTTPTHSLHFPTAQMTPMDLISDASWIEVYIIKNKGTNFPRFNIVQGIPSKSVTSLSADVLYLPH